MVQNNFPKIEEEILKFWQKRQIFKKSLEKPSKQGDPANTAGEFVFYDGPPFATGLPHYGHIIASAIKDVIPRYKTMRGFRVNRRWGWDCHGLPIENLIEKELELKTKKDIEKLGIDKFNEACQKSVLRYADEWKKFIPRMARWVDMENDYRTMDNRYIEVIWWIFKQLYDQNLIYEGYKSMHLCPRCETTLSNFEVTLGYKEVKDISVYVKFSIFSAELADSNNFQFSIPKDAKVYLLAWTTTPWTLPGNMTLAVGESIKYQVLSIKYEVSGIKYHEYCIVAKDRVKEVVRDKEYEVIDEVNGSELVGLEYEPLFDFAADEVKKDENYQNAFKVYPADFVSTEEGTGIVHIAPAFGEDDYQLSQKFNIPFLQHVKKDGIFKDYIKPWAGQKVREKDDDQRMNIEIIKWLAHHNQLFAKEKFTHSYPHCWRCDTPLLNYATSSWFVKIDDDFKKRLLGANKKINWVPKHLRDGRFGKWLEGARDWAISRSRYWGAPIPVWRCDKCQNVKVIGSVKELQDELKVQSADSADKITTQTCLIGSPPKRRNSKLLNLHRPYIDNIVLVCNKCQDKMKRIEEVFDCWFESGSMPYASEIMFSDYKLNADTSRQDLLKHIPFPADFIAEGIDQTRGWFYTLLVLAVGLYNQSPFKNVAVNGIILAEDGQKMSKRLKNYPDPNDIINKYGADALRFYLLSSPAVRGESLNFSEKGVDEVYKKVILLSLNVLRFWKQYYDNSKCKIQNAKLQLKIQNLLDTWIIERLNQLTDEVSVSLDKYEIDKACRSIADFVDDLSTWYLRRSRDRFKDTDKLEIVVMNLGYVLKQLSIIMAPICPFLAEHVYQQVTARESETAKEESVHLEVWPKSVHIPGREAGIFITRGGHPKDEILYNMQKVRKIMQTVREICEIGHSLRDKAGVKVRQVLKKLQVVDCKLQDELLDLIKDELNIKEIEMVDKLPKGEGLISKDGVALYTGIDDELREEGIVRELTRQINNLRKRQGLTIEDRVKLEYATESEHLRQVIEKNQEELKKAVLAREIIHQEGLEGEKLKVEGDEMVVELIK
ncbi:MAG: isoleucine--tRNA ligase [Candidatus Jacksonbacteria bacterium]